MSEGPWLSLIFLAVGAAVLVGLGELIARFFDRAEQRRLVWVATVSGLGFFTCSVLAGVPFWFWSRVAWSGSQGPVATPIVEDVARFVVVGSAPVLGAQRGLSSPDIQHAKQTDGEDLTNAEAKSDRDELVALFSAFPITPLERSLLIVWVIGTVALFARVSTTRGVTWWIVRRAFEPEGTPLVTWVRRQARLCGLKRPVRVLVSPHFATPLACGILHPVIGVPASFDVQVANTRDRAMLLHELRHHVNGDPWWRLVTDAVVALLWWHPASWWAKSQWAKASEEAADECSLMLPDGPQELATGLLQIGQHAVGARLGALAIRGEGLFRSHLTIRVQKLLNLQREQAQTSRPYRPVRPRLQGSITILTLLAVMVTSLGVSYPLVSLAGGGVSMPRYRWCWRQTVLAATLAAIVSPWAPPVLSEEGENRDRPAVEERREEVREREGERREAGVRREGEAVRDREARERESREREARREPPERPMAPPALERIERQLNELREELKRARERGEEERVRAIENQIGRLERVRENIRAGRPPEGGPGMPPAAREAMMERLERRAMELRERIREAERAGREGELRELRAEMERVEQAMRDVREGRMPGRPPGPIPPVAPGPVPPVGPGPMPPLAPERLERVRQAAELLRREGFGDVAELLMRAAGGGPPMGPRPDMGPPRPDMRSPRPDMPPGDRPREGRPRDPERDRPEPRER